MPSAGTPQPSGRGRSSEIDVAAAEARYHRERLALYRAKALTGKPTSPARLRELERIDASAHARLRDLRAR